MKTILTIAAVAASTSLGLAAAQPPKASQGMQAVLDQLSALGGRPIEQLTPEEARQQPTPADAVRALLHTRASK